MIQSSHHFGMTRSLKISVASRMLSISIDVPTTPVTTDTAMIAPSTTYSTRRAVGRVDARHRDVDADVLVGAQQMRRHEERGDEEAVFGQLDQARDRGEREHPQDHLGADADRHGCDHKDGQHAENAHQPAIEPEDQTHAADISEVRPPARHLLALSMTARSLPIESGLSLVRSSQDSSTAVFRHSGPKSTTLMPALACCSSVSLVFSSV